MFFWESVFWEHFIFSFKRVEIRKMSVVFWVKLYCKMGDIIGWFLLALRLFATNSGIKKTLMMSTRTCGLKLFARNNIFKNGNYKYEKYEILNHLYFGPSFVFWRTALGRFIQYFFLIFCRWSAMVANIFTHPPPPPHKHTHTYTYTHRHRHTHTHTHTPKKPSYGPASSLK